MNIQLEHISPNQIEQRSFEIISEELGDMRLTLNRSRLSNAVFTLLRTLIMQKILCFLPMQFNAQKKH